MSEELLVKHCSPTLAGMKTGNIFNVTFKNEQEMRENIRRYNRLFCKKGLRIIPLRYKANRALLYIYRPSHLSRDLQRSEAIDLLKALGYKMATPERSVIELKKRISENDEFPHEIGLFLGYPPEDVSGFIENRAENCKCVGCWKVYGDDVSARKLFAKYKKCTDVYCQRLAMGSNMERLAVNI